MHPAHLFAPYTMRELTLSNRIVVSPMCQYSAVDGFANDWHFLHLGTRAVGGAGLVLTEATAVSPEGRISPQDLGLWSDEHIAGLARIVSIIHEYGAAAGIQLAHAGRKSSMAPPWKELALVSEADGGWSNILAPSAVAFSDAYGMPTAMTTEDIQRIKEDFRRAAARAFEAGFDLIELHAAHGYLFHQFLSKSSNLRGDAYGGTFENRIRFLLETIEAIREVWPGNLPLIVRLSATDWQEFDASVHKEDHGWTLEDTVRLTHILKSLGIDLVDVSSGGNQANSIIPVGPGYQTGFADRLRQECQIPTAAVGMITTPEQADHIIRSGQADLVLLARELLRNPYWPLSAAAALRHEIAWPVQYVRAAGGRKPERRSFPERTV